MKIRLMGTEAECARLTFLLRFGPPELEVLEVDGPRPNRGDSKQVRVYLEARLQDVNPLVDRTFYSLVDQDGNPVLTDAWGNVVPTEEGDRRQVVVAYSITHGRRPDGWWFTVEIAGREREEHGPYADEDAVIAAKLDRMRELEGETERPAEPGERCTCGRQAVVVYLGGEHGPTGDCGIRDGGDRSGPCPFCGGPRHGELEGRCPQYRLRVDDPADHGEGGPDA